MALLEGAVSWSECKFDSKIMKPYLSERIIFNKFLNLNGWRGPYFDEGNRRKKKTSAEKVNEKVEELGRRVSRLKSKRDDIDHQIEMAIFEIQQLKGNFELP